MRTGAALLAVMAICLGATGCTARVDLNATGAVPASTTNLAVSVQEIWFSTSVGAAPGDASAWVKKTLPLPITLDFATLSSGTLLTLATQLKVPAGVYQEVYLVTADSGDALTASASSAGLTYNTQITTQASDGVVTTAPLEWIAPGVGLMISTSLDVQVSLAQETGATSASSSASSSTTATTSTSSSTGTVTSTLVMDFDATLGVLTYSHGSFTGYLSSARLRMLDAAHVGGIRGVVDASALVTGHAPVIVSAQALDSSGTHHVVVAQRVADTAGNFSLFPLPVATQGSTSYDVVISCADADTLIIRGVPVTAGAIASSTVVQTAAVSLTPATAVYADVASQLPLLPGGAQVTFLQAIVASGEVPYAIAGSAVEPLLRRLRGDAFALSNGPLLVGPYASGATVSLTQYSPVGGNGAYVPESQGVYRLDTLAAAPVVIVGTAAAPTQVLVPAPLLVTGGRAGALSVSVSAPAGKYDAGFVSVSAGNRLVETADISSLLPGGGGSVALSGIPAGSALVPSSSATAAATSLVPAATGVTYEVAVRAWSTADATGAVARAVAATPPVLGDSAVATAAVTVP